MLFINFSLFATRRENPGAKGKQIEKTVLGLRKGKRELIHA